MATEAEVAAASLARKRKVRGGHRGSATRTMNGVDVLLSEESPEQARLAQLKLSLEEKLKTLTRLDSEILDLTVDDEIQEADEFKDRVYEAIVRLDNCTRALSRRAVTPVTAAVTTSAPTPSTEASVVAHTTASVVTTEPVVVTTPASTAPSGGAILSSAAGGSTVTLILGCDSSHPHPSCSSFARSTTTKAHDSAV